MRKFFLLIALAFPFLIASQPARAANAGEKIINFDSQVLISHQNEADIIETITYDFGSAQRHGIYRDIPIDYQTENGQKYYLNAKYLGTTDARGRSIQAKTEEVSGNERIRLGDPDRTISGVHTYKIHYKLWPVVTKKDDRGFLNLDLVGTGWQVPIDKVTTRVRLENGAELSNIVCFSGSQGATVGVKNDAPACNASNLAPYQGVTINADFPKDYVDHYLAAGQMRAADVWGIILGLGFYILIGGAAIAAFVIFGLRKWRARQKRKRQTVVAQYDPPATLTPAEIGHLEDDSSSMAEVTATLISLAVRGYLKITPSDKTGLSSIFGGKDYTLTSLKPAGDLPAAEAGLYNAIFTKGSQVKLNDLDKSAMASAISTFKKQIKDSLEGKGYYDKKGGILQKGNLTDEGAKQWALVDGFKLYLHVVEKDRLAFSDAPAKTPERFNKLLPYAVALGVEKEWAKQFEGIDLSRSTSWYSGNMGAFSAVALTSDLSSGFASAVSSNSSVSSGGGSSGGGSGGGGGGSW